jgi:hypothetical protein
MDVLPQKGVEGQERRAVVFFVKEGPGGRKAN